MLGPLLLVAAFTLAGALAGGWAGGVVGAAAALLAAGAVAVSAAAWAHRIGRVLEPDDARAVAPHPPLFGRLCDWVYDRVLGD
jgi:hypothetical protein